MSTQNNRRRDPGGFSAETILLAAGIVIVIVGVAGLNLAVRLGHQLDGSGVELTSDPFGLVFQLFSGKVPWPAAGTWIIAGVGVLVLALVVLILLAVARYRKRSSRVDRAASYMGRGKDVEALSRRNAEATAQRLGVQDSPGVPIGKTIGGQPLYDSWGFGGYVYAPPRMYGAELTYRW